MNGYFLGAIFALVGVLVVIFRRPLAAFFTWKDSIILPDYFARSTPGGVALSSLIWFFLAALAVAGQILVG